MLRGLLRAGGGDGAKSGQGQHTQQSQTGSSNTFAPGSFRNRYNIPGTGQLYGRDNPSQELLQVLWRLGMASQGRYSTML